MKNRRKLLRQRRLLAWIMTFVMMCTGINIPVYAADTGFSDGVSTEIRNDEESDVQSADQGEFTDSSEEDSSFSGGEGIQEFTDQEEEHIVSAQTQNQETASVNVYLSVSDDETYVSDIGKLEKPVALQKLTVPYFDLAAYGLEKFYFSSEAYDSDGVQAGTAETAYNHVTMLHLFIYATEVLYCGIDEAEAGKGYLKEKGYLDDKSTLNISGQSSRGALYINNIWGMDQNFTYYKNYEYPLASEGWGSTADQILLKEGDVVTVSHYSDWAFYGDSAAGYNYLKADGKITEAAAEKSGRVSLEVWRTALDVNGGSRTIQKKMAGRYKLFYTPVSDMWDGNVSTWKLLGITDDNGELKVDLENISVGEYFVGISGQPGAETMAICSAPGGIYLNVTKAHTKHIYDQGRVIKEATCKSEGEKVYTCTICGFEKKEIISKTKNHIYGSWKTITKATVFKPAKQERICSVCKNKETRDYGKKLAAFIKLNTSSIVLQKGQYTTCIKVSMANGDSVKSWIPSDKKIVTASKNGQIKALKTGTTKVTVTLKSGKKASFTVKVQTGKVTTTKISGLTSRVTLKKGQKQALKPVISPVTSQDKVTYISSNKKIVTVSTTGVITAKNRGSAKITLKSGKKSYVIKITVK